MNVKALTARDRRILAGLKDPQERAMVARVDGRLGKGATRTVYSSSRQPGLAFKIEDSNEMAQNKAEYDVWQQVKEHPEKAKWFAGCARISSSDRVLAQQRAQPMTEIPELVPRFFVSSMSDMLPLPDNSEAGIYSGNHSSNWGMIAGSPVIVDYAFIVEFDWSGNWLSKLADAAMWEPVDPMRFLERFQWKLPKA